MIFAAAALADIVNVLCLQSSAALKTRAPLQTRVGIATGMVVVGDLIGSGSAQEQRAWRVLGESGAESRFEALRSVATQLVGRDEELDLLRRLWEQAKTSEGRVVLGRGLINAQP